VTETIDFRADIGVPDIAFRLADLTERFPPNVTYTVHRILSATQYGSETILLLERPAAVAQGAWHNGHPQVGQKHG
jgi:hypothetical protein